MKSSNLPQKSSVSFLYKMEHLWLEAKPFLWSGGAGEQPLRRRLLRVLYRGNHLAERPEGVWSFHHGLPGDRESKDIGIHQSPAFAGDFI